MLTSMAQEFTSCVFLTKYFSPVQSIQSYSPTYPLQFSRVNTLQISRNKPIKAALGGPSAVAHSHSGPSQGFVNSIKSGALENRTDRRHLVSIK